MPTAKAKASAAHDSTRLIRSVSALSLLFDVEWRRSYYLHDEPKGRSVDRIAVVYPCSLQARSNWGTRTPAKDNLEGLLALLPRFIFLTTLPSSQFLFLLSLTRLRIPARGSLTPWTGPTVLGREERAAGNGEELGF